MTTTLEDRALRFGLAATVSAYPTESFPLRLGAFTDAVGTERWASPLLSSSETRDGLEALRADFLQTFEVGHGTVPLNETAYGRTAGMSKGTELADLAGFYAAYGLEAVEGHEAFDHLAVELEFYAALLARQALLETAGDREGVEVVQATRVSFLADHLGRLATGLSTHVAVRADSAWAGAARFTVGLILEECAALGVTPVPLSFLSVQEPDEVACAVNLNPAGGRGQKG
ncbi:MAG: molecular chaperone TorD family protein [Myxococcaceae bacterium]|nr:molecular chaperone TorD family protein [Myxococcaceae bacterium]